jgi:hypothetical protein
MVTIDGISSLNLVKEEIDITLKQAENAVENFVDNNEGGKIVDCLEYMHQVKGVFRLIGLDGATLLIGEMEFLGNQIKDGQVNNVDEACACLGNALIVLVHYMEYVHVKQYSLPILLIPTINEIRALTGRELESESRFFSVDLNVVRSYENNPEQISAAALPQKCRRLRHMYQVGLVGVIRGENLEISKKLMLRALNRVDALCGNVPMGTLWWVSVAVMEALLADDLELSPARKSLLGRVDRQLKALVFQGATVLNSAPDPHLLKDLLFLVSLSSCEGTCLNQVRSAYGLDTTVRISDKELCHERSLMNGPGGSVIQTVAKALTEELSQVKDMLDLGARGAQEGFEPVIETLDRVSHTLVMLGLVDPSNVLKDLAKRIATWESTTLDLDGDEFHKVADALLYVENAIVELRKSRNSSPLEDMPVENEAISISQLEEARHVVVGESRAGLSLAKRAISSFIDSHWDSMHLNNVPTTLKTVWGGLKFLHLERAAGILNSCNSYIQTNLITADSHTPSEHSLETLADALTSIDYYLESMEVNKPIGDGVLEVAEESVEELGFPVAAA